MEGAGGRAMRLPPISPANSAAPDDDGGPGGGPEIDRERLLNDIANTGVMGALIGGFALSNVQMEYDMAVGLEVAIYLCRRGVRATPPGGIAEPPLANAVMSELSPVAPPV